MNSSRFAQFGRIIFEIRKNLSPALRISQITTHAASPLSDDLPVGGIETENNESRCSGLPDIPNAE